MTRAFLVFIGGGAGAVARYAIQEWAVKKTAAAFPWGTLFVNVSGSFLIGLILTLLLPHLQANEQTRLFLITGVLGGYTTFSAFGWESFQLFSRIGMGMGFLYVAATLIGGLAAVVMGVLLAQNF